MKIKVIPEPIFSLSAVGRSVASIDSRKISGGNAGGATPVPIPNTEVKPSRADDTALARVWESRTLPD